MRITVHHHFEGRCEIMRRLEALDGKIDLALENQEALMATLEELTAALSDISTEVDKVSADTDNLLAQLAAIPPGGLTPEQQAALDAAVASAQAIAGRLKTIDDKVPDAA